MTINPTERFDYSEPAQTEQITANPLPVGERALHLVMNETLVGKTLYEAAFDPVDVELQDVHAAVEDLSVFAVENGLLSAVEAESLRHRLTGLEPIELPTGKGSMATHLTVLMRDHPGQMNREPSKERRQQAIAMKALMHKFIRDDMSIAEIQDWIGPIEDKAGKPRNMFTSIAPEHVPVILAGGFDGLFREAATLPPSRLQNRPTALLDRFDPVS